MEIRRDKILEKKTLILYQIGFFLVFSQKTVFSSLEDQFLLQEKLLNKSLFLDLNIKTVSKLLKGYLYEIRKGKSLSSRSLSRLKNFGKLPAKKGTFSTENSFSLEYQISKGKTVKYISISRPKNGMKIPLGYLEENSKEMGL